MGTLYPRGRGRGRGRLKRVPFSRRDPPAQPPIEGDDPGKSEGARAAGDKFHGKETLWCLAAAASGLLLGLYQLLNTSIGWHLASGRWMLEHGAVLGKNPFTFSAVGKPWLDHEWIFQILAATANRLGGPTGLVVLRMLVVGLLALLLYRQSRRALLPPGATLLFGVLCLIGARWRLYLRPELLTLILLPLGFEVFLHRAEGAFLPRVFKLGLIMVLGINAHAGILLLPLLAALAAVAEQLQALLGRSVDPRALRRDIALLGVLGLSSLMNPWGLRAVLAPFRLAGLVSKPWVNNPEWFSPTWARFPELYLVIPVGFLLLLVAERRWSRRLPFLMISILALRYVRNEGVFFMLLPLLLGPALARLGLRLADRVDQGAGRRLSVLSAMAALLLCVVSLNAKGFPMGKGYAPERYPMEASKFLEERGLLNHRVYNDVRFGGWLIGTFYPPTQFFIDDRNEVHEELLKRIWEIQSSSSPRQWQEMLDSYEIRSALLKYRPSIPVEDPEGNSLGGRGWSALWFPQRRWALVYWDDIAMVLVDRKTADPGWLKALEYPELRPDDGEYLRVRMEKDPALREEIALELGRRLREDPDCRRARDLAAILLN